MHELSLCQAILKQALHAAARQQARRITRIELRVGALRPIDRDEIGALFPQLCRATIAEDAELLITQPVHRCYCEHCGDDFACAPVAPASCPQCGHRPCPPADDDDVCIEALSLVY